jgi:hypothetical protein
LTEESIFIKNLEEETPFSEEKEGKGGGAGGLLHRREREGECRRVKTWQMGEGG